MIQKTINQSKIITSFQLLVLCFSTLFSGHSLSEAQELSLKVMIKGFEPEKGQLILSLFDSEERFLQTPLITRTVSTDQNRTLEVVLNNLTSGTYAVAVIYDEDKNGELNTNFLGIPSELVGVSNNAKGFFGPPSYDDASFELVQNKELFIQLGKASD